MCRTTSKAGPLTLKCPTPACINIKHFFYSHASVISVYSMPSGLEAGGVGGAAPLLHEQEGVVVEVAVVVDVRLDAPVVVDVGEQRVMIEEAAEVAAHVMV